MPAKSGGARITRDDRVTIYLEIFVLCLIHCLEQNLGRISQNVSVLRPSFTESQIKAQTSAPMSSRTDHSAARLITVPYFFFGHVLTS